MAADYLHGVETLETEVQGQTITIVKSSVIALFGIAPSGPVNALTLCLSSIDDAQFGSPNTGFNIPKTLSIIRQIAGGCPVLVVNTFNASANLSQVAAEPQTVVAGKLKLTFEPIGAVTVLDSASAPVAFVAGVDYSIDAYGNFLVTSTAIANATPLKFTYKKLNAASITPSQLIGVVDSVTEARSGTLLFETAYNLFGYNPKIMIAPTFSTIAAVAAQLQLMADKYRGAALVDAPAGTTVSGAIAGRGPSGTINFNTANERTILLYPQLKTYDTATNANVNYPYSAFYAAGMVKNDNDNGYWVSPGNKEILGLTGVERNITASMNDASSEANQLNAAGITTIYNTFGTGIRTWGNRNAAYPSSTSAKNFINVQRADDIVSESIEMAALKYIDMGVTNAFIDLVREEGNNTISTLIQRGVFLAGSKVTYNPDDNSPAEEANGHIVFARNYFIPTPAERITFKNTLDISLLQSLK